MGRDDVKGPEWGETKCKSLSGVVGVALSVKMNHFQRLKEVKELKIFFFAQRANTRKQASSKRLLPCDALAPTAQNRASARCVNDTSARRRPAAIYVRPGNGSISHSGSRPDNGSKMSKFGIFALLTSSCWWYSKVDLLYILGSMFVTLLDENCMFATHNMQSDDLHELLSVV